MLALYDVAPIQRPSLARVVREARACRVCEARCRTHRGPVFRVGGDARLLIVGQAPGAACTKAAALERSVGRHAARLARARSRDVLRHERVSRSCPPVCATRVPCDGGDLPPRPECAPLGMHAFAPRCRTCVSRCSSGSTRRRITSARRARRRSPQRCMPIASTFRRYLPLPHPSWRNRRGCNATRGSRPTSFPRCAASFTRYCAEPSARDGIIRGPVVLVLHSLDCASWYNSNEAHRLACQPLRAQGAHRAKREAHGLRTRTGRCPQRTTLRSRTTRSARFRCCCSTTARRSSIRASSSNFSTTSRRSAA